MLSIRQSNTSQEYALPVLTEEAERALSEWYNNGKWDELVNPLMNCKTPEDPAIRVGSLFWPIVGAARFAYAVLPVDYFTLGLLRSEQAGGDILDEQGNQILDEQGNPITGDATNQVTLIYRDSPTTDLLDENGDPILDENGDPIQETSREFPMYMLASRPVSRTSDAGPAATEPAIDDLWLITLVDKRWYWVHETGSGEDVNWEPSSWGELFSSLFDHVLDAGDVRQDPIDSAYDVPSDRWSAVNMADMSTSYLLDDAAYRIGMRIVFTPDKVHLQRPSADNYNAALEFNTGEFDRFGGGGTIDSDEEIRGLPKTVVAVDTDGSEQTTDLSTGVTGARKKARLDKIDALDQWALDWHAWQYAPLDAIYDGFLWPPQSGFVGHAELFHNGLTGYTRISRPPIDWEEVLDCWPTGGAGSSGGTGGDTNCAPGCGWTAKLQTTDCLKLTVTCNVSDQTLLLTWDSGVSKWTSGSNSFSAPSNSGQVTFWISAGEPHLAINALELIADCSDGAAFFTGGPATGHGTSTGGSCDGVAFTVKVECIACATDVISPCCADPIPSILYICLVSGCNSALGCEFHTIPLYVVNEPIGPIWVSHYTSNCFSWTNGNGQHFAQPLKFTLDCFSGTWRLRATCGENFSIDNPNAFCSHIVPADQGGSCSPFDMTFSLPALEGNILINSLPVSLRCNSGVDPTAYCCTESSVWRVTAAPCTPPNQTLYDCVSGSCAESPTGAFSTLAACQAACSASCCTITEPSILSMSIALIDLVSCPLGTTPDSPVTFNKIAAGTWKSEDFLACINCSGTLTCNGGVWTLDFGNCSTIIRNITLVSAECDSGGVLIVFDAHYVCGVCESDITLTFTLP